MPLSRHSVLLLAFVASASIALHGPAARADAGEDRAQEEKEPVAANATPAARPGWKYLVDGGAVPFVYGSAAVYVGLKLFGSPRDTPLWFDDSEGGAEKKPEIVPEYAIHISAAAATVALAIPETGARWFHFKGAAQATLTSAALTQIAKNAFGRQRPYYDPATSTENTDRKSFFSGHASATLAVTTYAGLYLHQHVFARWRAPGQAFAWWESFPLAALAGVSVYVPQTRVAENRHHLSDVLAGAGVGMATSIAFYAWQERRYRRSLLPGRPDRAREAPELMVLPSIGQPGAALAISF